MFGKLDQNARLIAYLYELHKLNFSEGLVQLLELNVSILGFPLPFFGRLDGLRCLDVVPLGFLQVRQQLLLGQALKERGLINLLRFSNLNSLKVTY